MSEDDDNVVFVGNKDVKKYADAIKIQLQENETVHVKARGMDKVGKALVAAERVSNNHDKVVEEIETDTHVKEESDGDDYHVTAVSVLVTNE